MSFTILNHAQGSAEWLEARKGRITGSRFKDARDRLKSGAPSKACIAYAMDVAANWIIAPLVFLDWPREVLVTARLIRYKRTDTGWRNRLATFICEHLLDVFDPTGDHC